MVANHTLLDAYSKSKKLVRRQDCVPHGLGEPREMFLGDAICETLTFPAPKRLAEAYFLLLVESGGKNRPVFERFGAGGVWLRFGVGLEQGLTRSSDQE